jgi:transposase
MRKPIMLRPLSAEEQQAVQAGLRSTQSFTGRRCQILLASPRGHHARQIADQLSCGDQTIRNVLHAFNQRGLASLQPQSKAPRHRPQAVVTAARREQLRDLLHQSPRAFGYPTSLWTLPLVAQVAYAEGITPREVSGEAIRQALQRLRVGWKRAKHWITSPDPGYVRKKKTGSANPACRDPSGVGPRFCR